MRILVTGASGFVGRHLVASLRREDKSVTVLVRGGGTAGSFAGPADLAEIDRWPAWPAGIDRVIHLAALNPNRRDPADADALRRANVEGTAALARRAVREGVGRMVFVSTANVHGASGTAIREADALDPESAYARSKAEAETAFWRELQASATVGCVLRPAPVYGSGGRGNVASLVRLARLPLILPIGGIGGRRSLVAVDRLVDVVRLCLEADGAADETFLVADDGPVTPGEIVQALRRGWGRRGGVVALPTTARNAIAKRLEGRGPMASFVLDTSHLIRRTGWLSNGTSQARLVEMAASGEL